MNKIIKKSVTLENGKAPSLSLKNPGTLAAALISSGFFLGYFPVAQGTVGSIWIPFVLSIIHFFRPEICNFNYQIIIAVLVVTTFFLGVWSSGKCEKIWGHDPGRVVIDEINGTFIAILFLPFSFSGIWLGFLFFRFFDIFKPFPARSSEKLPGGWGVMADDVIAGIYANILVRIVLLLIPALF